MALPDKPNPGNTGTLPQILDNGPACDVGWWIVPGWVGIGDKVELRTFIRRS